jgi:hypothetical protein
MKMGTVLPTAAREAVAVFAVLRVGFRVREVPVADAAVDNLVGRQTHRAGVGARIQLQRQRPSVGKTPVDDVQGVHFSLRVVVLWCHLGSKLVSRRP